MAITSTCSSWPPAKRPEEGVGDQVQQIGDDAFAIAPPWAA